MPLLTPLVYNTDVLRIRECPRPDDWESPGAICLDSGAAPGPWSRWSYRPGPPLLHLRCDKLAGPARFYEGPRSIFREWADPLEALAWMASTLHHVPTAGPPFKGGWIGYLSYDIGRLFEEIPSTAHDDLDLPLFEFTWHNSMTACDLATGRFYACQIEATNRTPVRFESSPVPGHELPLQSTFTRDAYEAAVRRAIDYIAAGDIFQVNLAQSFTTGLRWPVRQVYDRLRRANPAWFGACLDYGDHALISNSPELFLRITPDAFTGQRHVITRPIKGTRPRRDGMEDALRDSSKDQAELNMIVDLERNDLGRVCRIGSVRVTEPRSIEAHPTVFHGVASVEGDLRHEVSFVDLLRATFPGGSITGAPKIRAMQIIEQLEPTRRGPYCGAIGYLSIDGHIEFNIAIRTMMMEHGRLHMPVGAGIVADSIPAAEYEETLLKAQTMFAAAGITGPHYGPLTTD